MKLIYVPYLDLGQYGFILRKLNYDAILNEVYDDNYKINIAVVLSTQSHISKIIHTYMYSRLSISRTRIFRILSVYMYLNQKYILVTFSNHKALETFYKSKLPEVQINLHFG